MKTTFRVIGRVIGKLTYVTTALIIAIVATVALFAYAGLHYYESYYKEYMLVQQSWSVVDDNYTKYINVIEDNIELIDKHVSQKNFSSEDEKTTAKTKVEFLKKNMITAQHSMSYKDKFASYPLFVNASKDILFILSENEDEVLNEAIASLNSIEKDVIKDKDKYNNVARAFNKTNEKFPESLIADIGSFHVWAEMP